MTFHSMKDVDAACKDQTDALNEIDKVLQYIDDGEMEVTMNRLGEIKVMRQARVLAVRQVRGLALNELMAYRLKTTSPDLTRKAKEILKQKIGNGHAVNILPEMLENDEL